MYKIKNKMKLFNFRNDIMCFIYYYDDIIRA